MKVLAIFPENGGAQLYFPWIIKKNFNQLTILSPKNVYSNLFVRDTEAFYSLEHDVDKIRKKLNSVDKIYYTPIFDPESEYKLFIDEIYDLKKNSNIEFNALLDNWIFYKERINTNIPNLIYVTDQLAQKYALETFGKISRIKLVKNELIEFTKIKLKSIPEHKKDILYIHSKMGKHLALIYGVHGAECICLDIENIQKKFIDKKIVIRLHPASQGLKCFRSDFFGKLVSDNIISLSENRYLFEDLACAKIVIGIPGYALYLANECGYETYQTRTNTAYWKGPIYPHLS
jgi:hypothetical protein